MLFEWMSDPAAWAGLATLIVLEIVLGIDNLVFIAILADKLPPAQRDRARLVGLSLALFMRLALLASIAWIVTLTQPLFSVLGVGLSGRSRFRWRRISRRRRSTSSCSSRCGAARRAPRAPLRRRQGSRR